LDQQPISTRSRATNLPPAKPTGRNCSTGFDYPEKLNAAVELTDRMVERGFGDHTALIGNGRQRTYKELADWSNRMAHALVEDYGVKPGNRVLIRSANNPAMVACWLGATKAGAVVVNTMPMLRAGELGAIVDKAEISMALCDTRLMDEIVACGKDSALPEAGDRLRRHGQPRRRARPYRPVDKSVRFRGGRDRARRCGAAGLHLRHHRRAEGDHALPSRPADHRRRLCEGSARRSRPRTCSSGRRRSPSPSGWAGWPCSRCASGRRRRCWSNASPANMIEIIQTLRRHRLLHRADCLPGDAEAAMSEGADLSSLRAAVSAGETLPAPVYDEWIAKTGKPMLDGIGATEMLHIFITNRFDDDRGRPAPASR
jgi:2-aminobenzoate-CoA ligase